MARIGDGGDLLKCSFCGKSQKQVKKLGDGTVITVSRSGERATINPSMGGTPLHRNAWVSGKYKVTSSYCQDLWMGEFQAASSESELGSGSTSLPFSKVLPARTRATTWGALKRPGFRSESQQGESEYAQEVQSRAA